MRNEITGIQQGLNLFSVLYKIRHKKATEQNASNGCRKTDTGRSPSISTARAEETNVEHVRK
jgi:hypothetical protein